MEQFEGIPNFIKSINRIQREKILSRIEPPSLIEKILLRRRNVRPIVVDDDVEGIWYGAYQKVTQGVRLRFYYTPEAALEAINSISEANQIPTHFVSDGLSDINAPFELINALDKKIRELGLEPGNTTSCYVITLSTPTRQRASSQNIPSIDKNDILSGRFKLKEVFLS
jgi:hypothetical protein